jgi:hypothetical protein
VKYIKHHYIEKYICRNVQLIPKNPKQVVKGNMKGKKGHGEATPHPRIGWCGNLGNGDIIIIQYNGKKDSAC